MFIGIGGLSRSGKTKLSRRLRKFFPGKKLSILNQDAFVKPEAEIPKIRDHIDWELPESIDYPSWLSAINEGRDTSDILIAEGLFAFSFPEINRLYDKAILVEIPRDLFFQRKREDLRWGKEPEWYIQYIWEAHQKYGLPPESLEVYRVAGNRPLDQEGLREYLRR